MHTPCIRVDSLLSAREYTAPIHSTGSHPNTSLLRARWTPACTLRRSHIGRYIPGAQLLPQAVRGATSTRSACTLRVERPRRTAVHFFPHTRPPDTHSHLSQPPTTPPLDSGAAVEYQGHSGEHLLFACSDQGMPNGKRRGGLRRRPPGVAMMARSRDDAASEIETASIDGDRNMSTSFAREGSGDSARREDSGGFDRRRPDRDPSPFLPMRGAGRGGFSRRSGTSSPLPAAAGGGARGGEHEERSRLWKKADFPTDDALRKCRVHRHEDLPRHIYLLLDILGLQFRWVLTRFGRGRALVSAAAQLVDDQKEHAWMTLYAHDRDVLETLLYRRLQTLWHDCTDALAVFAKHRADTELCGQKVWEALLTAFPLDHKRMQTVLLATEFGNLMAWDGRTKADVDRHFSNITDTLEMLTFLGDNIDIEAVFKALVLATLKSSQTKALTKAYSVILDNLDDDKELSFDMIQKTCVRKLRERNNRGDDRHFERRPATPHRGSSSGPSSSGPSNDKAHRHSRSKSLSRPADADYVSAFLVNFLADRGVKASQVLKDADLDPNDVRSGYALRALLAEADNFIPATIHTDTDGDGTDCCSDSQASSASAAD